MEKRRRAKRVSIFLAIKEVNQKPVSDCHLLDISETGAKIDTSLNFASGDLVEFSFVLPDIAKEIRRTGQVIWVIPNPAKPGNSLVGLEYTAAWELGSSGKE
jgi:Tfp pilus assembly protein PilZ